MNSMTAPAASDSSASAVRRNLPDTPVRKSVETDAYADFMKRALRAYARRVADGDVEALRSLRDFEVAAHQAVADAALGLHDFGYSWQEIADRVGVTKQTAYENWSRKS